MESLMDMNALINQLIRPPKFTYSLADLGDALFELNGVLYERIDFNVQVPENQETIKLYGSLWRQRHDQSKNPCYRNKIKRKTLIYMHCNCGSRVESIQILKEALKYGNNFVAFDSRGSGHSGGKYITLGYHEATDLVAILQYLKNNFSINSNFILWGRSMGAVAILNFLTSFPQQLTSSIILAILDSPFINLSEVICETMNNRIGVPKVLINLFLNYLEPKIQEKVKFNVSDFDLRNSISQILCPLILMASKQDGVVPFHHLQQIYNLHSGRKTIFYLTQTHIQQRKSNTIQKVFKGIDRYCKVNQKIMIKEMPNSLKRKSQSKFIFQTPQVSKKKSNERIYSHRGYEQGNSLSNKPSTFTTRKKIMLTSCQSKSVQKIQFLKQHKQNFILSKNPIEIGNSRKKKKTFPSFNFNQKDNISININPIVCSQSSKALLQKENEEKYDFPSQKESLELKKFNSPCFQKIQIRNKNQLKIDCIKESNLVEEKSISKMIKKQIIEQKINRLTSNISSNFEEQRMLRKSENLRQNSFIIKNLNEEAEINKHSFQLEKIVSKNNSNQNHKHERIEKLTPISQIRLFQDCFKDEKNFNQIIQKKKNSIIPQNIPKETINTYSNKQSQNGKKQKKQIKLLTKNSKIEKFKKYIEFCQNTLNC